MSLSSRALNTLIGSTAQLSMDIEAAECYPVKFIGYADNQSLIFSAPADKQSALPAPNGEELIVRFQGEEQQFAFKSKVLEVCNQPYRYLHLSFPVGVEASFIRRGQQRYAIKPTELPSLHLKIDDGANQHNVKMSDISQNGACLSAASQLGAIDEIFSIDIVVDKKQVTVPCRIRYIRKENNSGIELPYIHGVEFCNLEHDAETFISQLIATHIKTRRAQN